jgi:hypothetical protein
LCLAQARNRNVAGQVPRPTYSAMDERALAEIRQKIEGMNLGQD